jgi:TPR repeat protein
MTIEQIIGKRIVDSMTSEQKIAVRYYKAAEEGDGGCYGFVGMMYETGEFSGGLIAKDEAKAVEWYLKAIEDNECPESLYRLGLMYAEGRGTVRDKDKAIELLSKFVESGKDYGFKEKAQDTLTQLSK